MTLSERFAFYPNLRNTGSILKRDASRISILNNAREKEEATMGLIYGKVVGLIAGWLAGKVMKGGGYGVLVDIVLGILGGIFGG